MFTFLNMYSAKNCFVIFMGSGHTGNKERTVHIHSLTQK